MMESMSLLALELNEARKRELALAAMHASRGIEMELADERAWSSPTPQLVLVEAGDCAEQLAA
jgi:hypothetical protein